MEYDLIPRKERDLGRGAALLVCGAVMVLLTWILPSIAFLVAAAYGIYRLFLKEISEGLIALAVAVAFYIFSGLLAGLLWIVGALATGAGLFFLIRALLEQSRAD